MPNIFFRVRAVKRVLADLSINKSPGPDGIPALVLKQCSSTLGRPLANIFSILYHADKFNACWKIANVTPIPKKGENYRPIAICCALSKVMGNVVNFHLVKYLETNNLLNVIPFTILPNSVADKSVCVEDLPENTKAVEEADVSLTIKEHADGEIDETKTVVETVTEKLKEEDDEEEVEEIIEEVEAENNDEEVEEGVTQKITEKVVDNPDGEQTKTITVTTVKKVTPSGTKTVVTTTSSTKETPTIITSTPPTPTTEEVKTETNAEAPIEKTVKKQVSEEKKEKHNEHEEKEEEEIEEEEEEEEKEEAEKVNEEVCKKLDEETKKSDESSRQKVQHDQIPSKAESQPSIAAPPVKEEIVTDAPSAAAKTNQQENVKQVINYEHYNLLPKFFYSLNIKHLATYVEDRLQ
ncbi:101 kDa malaria antigen-like [Lucilia cuprina]|uniref:101 kDa malaria antigen-like n=1 Tax=Lucilia cuprina TaxID=7375 RepID=UPI001F052A8E|nr:101 kDa malaria antigen-like [Lucilia cuprina]